MKKKLLSILLASTMIMAFTGCGSKADTEEGLEKGIEKYVTVGDISSLEVETTEFSYTEKELKDYAKETIESYTSMYDLYEYTPIEDKTTVESGDTVNIDYEGKKDDVPFEGGTAQGYRLEIGSNSFIPGFEDGLIGANVGEVVDLDLTFPEEYFNEELAGQSVVFTVSVNSIDEKTAPEYNSDFFMMLGIPANNYDEYIEYMRQSLDEEVEYNNSEVEEEEIWRAVVDICEVKEIPQSILDEKEKAFDEYIQSYADMYGSSFDDFLTMVGYTQEDYDAEKKAAAQDEARSDLICIAIAKQEGIKVTDADVDAMVNEEYANYGYSSPEEMLQAYDKKYLRDNIRYTKVMEKIKELVKVKKTGTASIMDKLY